MSDIAIKVENLGKSYIVGHESAEKERYTALRDVIAKNAKSFVRKSKDMLTGKPIVQGEEIEEFWALKDIHFEIKQGERVGIIGRNGAGKSTLLKILSRITEPTTGRVSINGRVASLLEAGTGFHPELTGRENIYLNGAILGMSRKEIQRKFDEIIDFAEVEKFLDTPVKRYSSGMYVRLAFAVAAHLEPEILVVDEVLAVGDAQFQEKCLGKMQDVASRGRTVLFVSHNMGAIQALCESAILFDRGSINMLGEVSSVVSSYYRDDSLRAPEPIKVEFSFMKNKTFWGVNDDIMLTITNETGKEGLMLDISFYDESRVKLFSFEGTKLRDPIRIFKRVAIKIKNPGIVNTKILVDVGLKLDKLGGYEHLSINATELQTEFLSHSNPVSGRFLPKFEVVNDKID
jgi:ABC-type polysaccharide/polyol phosphate transport system ATPase subunit